jgi:DNA-binding NarL/FixJ family response regulator
MSKRVGIIIADDHAVLRESLAALLQTQADFHVLARAASGGETLALVRQHHPDVLVLDLFMPDGDGFEVLRGLERDTTPTASLILTASENELDFLQAVRLGARGLVLKSDTPEKLFGAIRSVAAGELAFSDDIAHRVVSTMARERGRTAPTGIHRLSERERRVAFLVARGLRNRQIAAELHISENTVKRHLQSIFNKTGVRDRLELAVMTLTEQARAA